MFKHHAWSAHATETPDDGTERRARKPSLNEIDRLASELHATFIAFAQRRTASRADAEDIVQDFYLRILRTASGVRSTDKVQTWRYRVLESAIVDHYRKAGARRRLTGRVERLLTEPEDRSEEHEAMCRCIHRFLPVLRPQYRDVLERVYLREGSREDVATALGVTVNNLTVRLLRARRALGALLLDRSGNCKVGGFCGCGEQDRVLQPPAGGQSV